MTIKMTVGQLRRLVESVVQEMAGDSPADVEAREADPMPVNVDEKGKPAEYHYLVRSANPGEGAIPWKAALFTGTHKTGAGRLEYNFSFGGHSLRVPEQFLERDLITNSKHEFVRATADEIAANAAGAEVNRQHMAGEMEGIPGAYPPPRAWNEIP